MQSECVGVSDGKLRIIFPAIDPLLALSLSTVPSIYGKVPCTVERGKMTRGSRALCRCVSQHFRV
jgi:hypothetical protein